MPQVTLVEKQRGKIADTFNILFLGDGFVANDISLFFKAVKTITKLFFRQRPFNLLGVRDKFNVFSSFTYGLGSVSGITCKALVNAKGEPDSAGSATTPIASKFGLYYDAAIPRMIGVANAAAIPSYIANNLIYPGEPTIPSCWAPGGKSYGYVIVLINDDMDAGSSFGAYLALTLGLRNHLNITSTAPPYTHKPDAPKNKWPLIVSTIVHELGHSVFGLADEYVDPVVGVKYTDPPYNTKTAANVTTIAEGQAGGRFWAGLKWNKPRFLAASSAAPVLPIIHPDEIMKIQFQHPLPAGGGAPVPHSTAVDGATQISTVGGVTYDGSRMKPKAGRAPAKMTHSWKWIGLYQGANGDHHDLYRPAGDCKMRNYKGIGRPYVQFCYVCKYEIIKIIDPSLLPVLASTPKMYP